MSEGTTDAPRRARLERELSVLLLGLVVLFALGAIVDPDLPGHIRYGADHLAEGHLPLRDPYSYSVDPSAVWINHEVLFELTVGWLFTRLGAWSLVLLQGLVWGVAGGLTLWLLRRSTRDFVPGALFYLLFAAASFAAVTIRPQLFTYLSFALLLTLLELARAGRRWALAGIPPLFVFWVNAHGGFLAGLGILAAYVAGLALDALLGRAPPGERPERPEPSESRRTAALACGAALLAFGATFLNSYGVGLWAWLFDSLGRPRTEQITEWRPIQLDVQGVLFLLLVALTAAGVGKRLLRERDRVPLPHLLVLGATAVVALRHARHAPFFAMAACAFAAGAFADLYRRAVPPPDEDLEPGDLRRVRLLYGVILLPALLLNLSLPQRDFLDLRLRAEGNSTFPTGAYRYMEENEVEGNMLVYFDWAQLVIWRFHPDVRVFYDGRFRTVYGPEVEEAFFAFISRSETPGWREALDAWPTEWVLMPAEHPVAARLAAQPDFALVYRGELAVLYRRLRPGQTPPEPIAGPVPSPVIPFRPR